MAQRKTTDKDSGFSFRANAREKALIDRAARSHDLGPSAYARRSVIKQAEMDLADETSFTISAQDMTAFMAALDRAPQAKPRLKKLLTEKTVLE